MVLVPQPMRWTPSRRGAASGRRSPARASLGQRARASRQRRLPSTHPLPVRRGHLLLWHALGLLLSLQLRPPLLLLLLLLLLLPPLLPPLLLPLLLLPPQPLPLPPPLLLLLLVVVVPPRLAPLLWRRPAPHGGAQQ